MTAAARDHVLADLRKKVEKTRADYHAALAGASAHCRERREKVSAAVKAERAKALAELRAELREKGERQRAGARSSCEIDKREASALRELVKTTRKKLAAERAHLAKVERAAKAKKPRGKSAETKSESDDAVRANLPPDLVPIFDAVRSKVKAGPRVSRTEAFLEWAELQPGEVEEIRAGLTDDATDALVREYEARSNPGKPKGSAMARARAACRELAPGLVRALVLATLGAESPEMTASARRRAVAEYQKTHWGAPGSKKISESECANPFAEILVKMGQLVAIEYETHKQGDPRQQVYRHEFARPLAALAYSQSTGRLVIAGGGYRVTKRGIEK